MVLSLTCVTPDVEYSMWVWLGDFEQRKYYSWEADRLTLLSRLTEDGD